MLSFRSATSELAVAAVLSLPTVAHAQSTPADASGSGVPGSDVKSSTDAGQTRDGSVTPGNSDDIVVTGSAERNEKTIATKRKSLGVVDSTSS